MKSARDLRSSQEVVSQPFWNVHLNVGASYQQTLTSRPTTGKPERINKEISGQLNKIQIRKAFDRNSTPKRSFWQKMRGSQNSTLITDETGGLTLGGDVINEETIKRRKESPT